MIFLLNFEVQYNRNPAIMREKKKDHLMNSYATKNIMGFIVW